jgi:hypothetical protein
LAGNALATSDAVINGFAQNNDQPIMKLGKKIVGLNEQIYLTLDNNGGMLLDYAGTGTALTITTGGQKAFEILDENGDEILQLDNDGLMHSREIRVDALVWPDYVFEADYDLKPLSELKEFITAKGHLPNIPSEKDILENGINVSEMQQLQMEKIEELTLYMIQMDEKMNQMEGKITALEKENASLKSK